MLSVRASRSSLVTCLRKTAAKKTIIPSSTRVATGLAVSRIRTMSTNATGTPSATAKVQAQANAQGGASPPFESYLIKNTKINEAAGVSLSSQQKLLVGSVLDVRPSFFSYSPLTSNHLNHRIQEEG